MATDASIEGMLDQLASRPKRPSLFFRDEFSGLLEQMGRRDYLAGMSEAMAALYDGELTKRALRKGVIEVKDPVLLIFAGGIKTKILHLLTDDHITSGFIPRFVFITADANKQERRPIGRPNEVHQVGRDQLVQALRNMQAKYVSQGEIKVGPITIPGPKAVPIDLTDDAWQLYNAIDDKMVDAAQEGENKELLTPVMDRLSKSGLKAAMLIAASRLREPLRVEEVDIYKAFSYVTEWRKHVLEVVSNVGLSVAERTVTNIQRAIDKHPGDGVTRSELMRAWHLHKRDADNIFDTLEQRGLITRVRSGNTERLYPT